jgi:hypothetical protein
MSEMWFLKAVLGQINDKPYLVRVELEIAQPQPVIHYESALAECIVHDALSEKSSCKAEASCSVRRWLLHMIDHENIDRSLCRYELQSQLFLDCGEKIRRGIRALCRRMKVVRRPPQPEIKPSRDSSLIHHWLVQSALLHRLGNIRHRCVRRTHISGSEPQAWGLARVALAPGQFGTGLCDGERVYGYFSLVVMEFELKPIRHQLLDHRLPLLDAWLAFAVGFSGYIVRL